MPETIDNIVKLSYLPISVIIIGIGSADFSKMDSLDSDDALLRGRSGVAKRDIVQFVPFNKFKANPAMLAAEVLRELPRQVTGFYKMMKMAPKPSVSMHMSALNQMGANVQFDRTGNAMDAQYMQKSRIFFLNLNRPKGDCRKFGGAFGAERTHPAARVPAVAVCRDHDGAGVRAAR
jgi:hypothetical protein